MRKQLRESASYPRGFGYAVAELMVPRTPPQKEEVTNFDYEGIGDDFNCLSDILHGASRTWWRKI